MAITNKMWEIGTLLENIGEARNGLDIHPNISEKEYIEDVKKRVPEIEKALNELKSYLERVQGDGSRLE